MDFASIFSKLPKSERDAIRAALDDADRLQLEKPKPLSPEELAESKMRNDLIKYCKLYKPALKPQ